MRKLILLCTVLLSPFYLFSQNSSIDSISKVSITTSDPKITFLPSTKQFLTSLKDTRDSTLLIQQFQEIAAIKKYKGFLADSSLQAKWPGLLEGYPFQGYFAINTTKYPFSANRIITHELYIDASQKATIDYIANNWKTLDLQDLFRTKQAVDKVYWLKIRFNGSPYFNGEHTFSVQGDEAYSFDYIDTYIFNKQGTLTHQQTGDKIALEKRPYDFWANLIKIDLLPSDTLDVFIRLAGANSRYLGPIISLYHIDKTELFPPQIKEAWRDGIFYGILGIQCLYFLILFFIERERIHLYFFVVAAGFFLTFGFHAFNFLEFMPFPALRNQTYFLQFLGIFLMTAGALKFTETYFNYPENQFPSKKLLSILILLSAIVTSLAFFSLHFFVSHPNLIELLHQLVNVCIVLTIVSIIIMGVRAKEQVASKSYFFLAFTPLFIASLFMLGIAIANSLFGMELPLSFSNQYDLIKLSIIIMLTLLALSAGHRTNRLKAEKAAALEKNLSIQRERLDEQQRINQAISKFVPNEFLTALGKSNIKEINLGDTVEKEVSILFSDIRNFTSLSEKMSPKENFQFVNAYNKRMGPIIQQQQGFVNQYLGDGIMAIFPNSSKDALQAAIDMQKEIQQYNIQRAADGKTSLKVGMGLHSGSLIMGITGDENRMDAATISDSVNSASRIENLTKHYGASILLSEESLNKFEDATAFNLRYLGEVQVKGKQEPIKIYECFDGDLPESKALKIATLTTFNQGVQLYFQQEFEQASYLFQSILEQHPSDATAKLFLTKAKWLLKADVEENWTGIERMEKY